MNYQPSIKKSWPKLPIIAVVAFIGAVVFAYDLIFVFLPTDSDVMLEAEPGLEAYEDLIANEYVKQSRGLLLESGLFAFFLEMKPKCKESIIELRLEHAKNSREHFLWFVSFRICFVKCFV